VLTLRNRNIFLLIGRLRVAALFSAFSPTVVHDSLILGTVCSVLCSLSPPNTGDIAALVKLKVGTVLIRVIIAERT